MKKILGKSEKHDRLVLANVFTFNLLGVSSVASESGLS